MNVELGISTFGETTPLEKTGKAISHDERIRNLIEEVELADQVGISFWSYTSFIFSLNCLETHYLA